MLQYIINRLTEKSTWVSLGTLATVIGWKAAPQYWDTIAMIGMGIGGLLGTMLPSTVNASNVDHTK